MWARQASILREIGADPIAVVRAPGQAPLGLPSDLLLWHDTVADAGPLAGLHTALTQSRTSVLAVLAIDMPHVDAWWFQWLGSFSGSTIGAIACRPNGDCEPLAAVYPRLALKEVAERLNGPDRSLQSLARALISRQLMRSIPLPESETWRVTNWNTPEDRMAGV